MSIINQDINFEDIKKIYQQKKYITIENFLSEETADLVYSGLKDISDKKLWYTAQYGKPKVFYNFESQKDRRVYNFSYKYDMFPLKNHTIPMMLNSNITRPFINKSSEISDNPEMEIDWTHPLRKFSDFLNSKEMHSLIRYITEAEITDNDMMAFASSYTYDDFLALHNDGSNEINYPRKIAFVLSMTKNWLVNWGGALIFVNEDENTILKTLIPCFNTLTIFTVPIKHVVLPVSSYCQSERFSITGWYQYFSK